MRRTKMDVKIIRGPDYDYERALKDGKADLRYLPRGFISEVLTSEIYTWSCDIPVAIFSDTGTGKSSFVEGPLVSFAEAAGCNMIYLSNRVSVGRQTKQRLAGRFGMESELRKYSDEGLDDLIDFGCMKVLSYQKLAAWIDSKSSKLDELLETRFMYVVMDECHYFTADASFSPYTDAVLDFLTENFKDSIRIYLTATPEEIFPVLKRWEKTQRDPDLWTALFGREIDWKIYQFEHDFSRFVPHAFVDLEDIAALIRNTPHDEKTIAFVESKEVGEKLIDACGFGTMITADSKNPGNRGYDTLRKITENECFPERLVVATAVLENGVNLKDTTLKNVVIYADNKTRFRQMLGRVRKVDEQKIHVFIPDVSARNISAKLDNLKAQLEACEIYRNDKLRFSQEYICPTHPRCNVRGALAIGSNGMAHLNPLFAIRLKYCDIPFWERMEADAKAGIVCPVLQEKFSWIGQRCSAPPFIPKIRARNAELDLTAFLERYVGKAIGKMDQEAFKTEFSTKYKAAYGMRAQDKTKDQQYGISTIRGCLTAQSLPYVIERGEEGWMVKRKEREENEEEV